MNGRIEALQGNGTRTSKCRHYCLHTTYVERDKVELVVARDQKVLFGERGTVLSKCLHIAVLLGIHEEEVFHTA